LYFGGFLDPKPLFLGLQQKLFLSNLVIKRLIPFLFYKDSLIHQHKLMFSKILLQEWLLGGLIHLNKLCMAIRS
jgi:hypothetical protein